MIWGRSFQRRDLLELFGGQLSGFHLERVDSPWSVKESPGGLWIAWGSEQPKLKELPLLIIVPKRDFRDFLAWTATYIGAFKPLTAFTRVVYPEQFESMFTMSTPLLRTTESAWIGAAIGEAVVRGSKASELSVQACMSSCLFAAGRGASLKYNEIDLEDLMRRWEKARLSLLSSASGGSSRPEAISQTDLRTVASLLFLLEYGSTLFNEEVDLIRLCRGVMHGQDDEVYLREFAGSLWKDSSGRLEKGASAAREDRLRLFYQATDHLKLRRDLQITAKSFLAAYLMYRVAPGSIEYIDLLLPLQSDFPLAIVWYGVLAGLHPRTELLNQFDCLGMKVSKELLARESIWDRPRCDLAVDELEVLLSGGRAVGWRSGNPGRLIVELAPTIYTALRWHGNGSAAKHEQGELFGTKQGFDQDQQTIIDELRTVFVRGRTLLDKLDPAKRGTQGDVEARAEKKKGRRRSEGTG